VREIVFEFLLRRQTQREPVVELVPERQLIPVLPVVRRPSHRSASQRDSSHQEQRKTIVHFQSHSDHQSKSAASIPARAGCSRRRHHATPGHPRQTQSRLGTPFRHCEEPGKACPRESRGNNLNAASARLLRCARNDIRAVLSHNPASAVTRRLPTLENVPCCGRIIHAVAGGGACGPACPPWSVLSSK
jgi:hypothetical protein